MNLRKITKLSELAVFIPKLLELHDDLEGKWEPELTRDQFAESLLDFFSSGSWFFGDIQDDKIVYFVAINREGPKKIHFWLFYMNPDYRTQTKLILHELKSYAKSQGIETCYTQSTRTESSYERWLEKFGAKKLAIVYKFNL